MLVCRGLSRRLTALEDSVGSRLLIRGGREFTLTAQGQAARESAEQIEEAVAQVSRLVRSEHLSSGGTVRVSVSPGFIVPMMPMLDIARIKYPNLDIQLLGDYRRVDLAKGEADIAVRMARPDELGLVGRHPLVLYAESMHNVPPLRWLESHRDAATRFTRVDNLEIAMLYVPVGPQIAGHPVGAGRLAVEIGDDQIDRCEPHIGLQRQLGFERPDAERRHRRQHHAENRTQRRIGDKNGNGADRLGHRGLQYG